MLKTVIATLTPNYSQLKGRSVFLILSVLSFVLRFPFFFRDYIDRDESTFILMGQSWVDGHLPYTELWDLKPPITFLVFAAVIYVFGKSFIAIRIFGTLLVVSTAFFTYKIGEKSHSKKIGLWAALGTVMLLSLFGSLQGVMSEHICMAFFMPGLYVLLQHKKPLGYLSAGLLMGLAVMSKMNIAYAILFLGVFILYDHFSNRNRTNGILYAFIYGIGIVLVIALTYLPYYLQGEHGLWVSSVFKAPIAYIGARRYSFLKLAPVYVILAGFFVFAWKKKLLNLKETNIQYLLVAIVGVLFAFYKGGRINGHYLIQLHPMLLLLVVMAFHNIKFFKKIEWKPYYLFILLLIPMESYLEYANIVKNKIERGTFFNGEGISVPKYIKENGLDTKNILFLGYHIGYWSLDVKPPTKAATHPSNICRDELFPFHNNPRATSMEELRYLMETLQPKTVVIRKNKRVFDKKEIQQNEYIDAFLAKHYQVHATVENAEILQRSER
ncbi:ArnT family glycosyltransferase [Maribacter polysaccharolyticus]|uniref:ArnT family glycosyltransferase n=1 Tax=Maribacter polysaccharolyticus TaxID=3020831 RepID=UPI00237F6F21|nr:glycosyltransferase family 39 protein [Maribacter polysaccharolyticus]MDE3743057.1 glycosyltransferase family 39 protein [Maribacter polysaccharolyticus]